MSVHVLALTSGGFFDDIGRSLKEGFFMFNDTLWALVLGFGLSGAVQAFVSRSSMQRRLGNHRPAAVLRASGYGVISSSCSYAASAMAKSLFDKGADFVTSMVFMFASTNLVVELGVVLAVLIGWQFVAAEFVGGTIMIVLLVLLGGFVFRGRALERARRGVDASASQHDTSGSRVGEASSVGRARTLAGWSDAASFTIADLTMLRREMLVGYSVAGFLAVLVPVGVWNDLFLRGHGLATTAENAFVGPLIALVSYVCSIGNVPLAAALWRGGISFGGVVSFIFGDLVAMPLLLIYRKLYGGAMALRMLGVFWAVMSLAGLVTGAIFESAGIASPPRPRTIGPERFAWDYTGVLDVVCIAGFLAIYLLAKNRDRFGADAGFETDPVCGMRVARAQAPASTRYDGSTVYFCSDRCRERFRPGSRTHRGAAAGGRLAARLDASRAFGTGASDLDPARSLDPVCGMSVDADTALTRRGPNGAEFQFCCSGCADAFEAEAQSYLLGETSSEPLAPEGN